MPEPPLTRSGWRSCARKIDRKTPKDKTLHLIVNNYAARKHPAVQQWLAKHARFFRDITTERLRRGVFARVPGAAAAIKQYVALHNTNPKPFIWTKSTQDILHKDIRANSR